MENFKCLNLDALRYNLACYQSKKVVLMVKSNAYGHGVKEIVSLTSAYVDAFGVVSEREAEVVRNFCDKRIIIFAPATNLNACREGGVEIIVDNEEDLRKAIDCGCKIHLAINVGMNRFGTKSEIVLKSMNNILEANEVELKSIYTHFPDTRDPTRTKRQYERFCNLRKLISRPAPVCFGGSGIYNYPFSYDAIRLGIGAYGYEKNRMPVMSIVSHITKIFYAKSGEYIGYGKKYRVKKADFFGVVNVGYGDGLMRALSQNFSVEINGKRFEAVGNICMDAFFVKIDKSVSVGDEVLVMSDASYLAKRAKTIPYEILTNFSNLRGTVKKITSNKK